MRYLLLASLLWAFSFGLIKGRMAGLDPATVAAGRLLLAALAFSWPLVRATTSRSGPATGRVPWRALVLGALQFGLMYWLYISAYAYLQAWQVAFFTVFTPIYVVLMADLGRRRLHWRNLGAGLLAVVGAALTVTRGPDGAVAWKGILLLQGANLCFAVGQVLYPRLKERENLGHEALMGWMYWGAFVLAAGVSLMGGGPRLGGWAEPALITLLYLGLVPTAVGFYLWNRGASQVSPGRLGVANNLKIPLAVVVSWLVFGEEAPWLRASLGLMFVVGGLFLARTDKSE